jgi:arsenate reductase
VWAQTAAAYHDVPANCFSGGVEVTAFNERAVESVKRSGFEVTIENGSTPNPYYLVRYSEEKAPIRAFSKLFDDHVNSAGAFAAVMVCSHADENCPFIPGTEKRISVQYDDPKAFDGTPEEANRYDERSAQVAGEMFYVFGQVKEA